MTYLSQNLSSERLVLESWGKDQSYSYLILHNKIEKLKFYSLSKPYRSERVKESWIFKLVSKKEVLKKTAQKILPVCLDNKTVMEL